MVESARRRGEIAIGYRLQTRANDAAAGYGIVLNPDKADPVTFDAEDHVIVIAEA